MTVARIVGRGVACYARLVACLLPALLTAQTDLKLGAQVFVEKCANQYCHGSAGEEGPAPRLAGRGLRERNVTRPIVRGVPNTNMPGWEKVLSTEELDAVIDYVLSIQYPVSATEVKVKDLAPNRPSLKHPGRDLFFDAGRVGSCGNCHEFDGLGVAVAAPIKNVPDGIAALRDSRPESVQTVTPASGKAFAGLDAGVDGNRLRFVDLGPKLPVLRSFGKGAVNVESGGDWTHAPALALYTNQEQRLIFEYLRVASR